MWSASRLTKTLTKMFVYYSSVCLLVYYNDLPFWNFSFSFVFRRENVYVALLLLAGN